MFDEIPSWCFSYTALHVTDTYHSLTILRIRAHRKYYLTTSVYYSDVFLLPLPARHTFQFPIIIEFCSCFLALISSINISLMSRTFVVGIFMPVSAGILLMRNASTTPEVLLLRSAEGRVWGLPKGHLNQSERTLDAALREIFEETGLTMDQFELVEGFHEMVAYRSRSNRNKTVAFFLGRLSDSNAKINLSSEHSAYVWTTQKEAISLVNIGTIRNLISYAFAFYRRNRAIRAITAV